VRPVSISPETSLHEAVELRIEHNISGLAVVDSDGTIVGALEDRDLLKVFTEPEAHTAASVMTPDSGRAARKDLLRTGPSSPARHPVMTTKKKTSTAKKSPAKKWIGYSS
jgi:CBS domain-containing protein